MPRVNSRGVDQVKFERVSGAVASTTEVVAAVAGKKIRVLSYVVTVDAAGELEFQDDATTPNELAHYHLAADGGVSYAGHPEAPAFETAVGQALDVVTGVGQAVEGHLTYVEA